MISNADWLNSTRVKMAELSKTNLSISIICLIFISSCYCGRSDHAEDHLKVAELDVKPGGERHVFETEMVYRVCFPP